MPPLNTQLTELSSPFRCRALPLIAGARHGRMHVWAGQKIVEIFRQRTWMRWIGTCCLNRAVTVTVYLDEMTKILGSI